MKEDNEIPEYMRIGYAAIQAMHERSAKDRQELKVMEDNLELSMERSRKYSKRTDELEGAILFLIISVAVIAGLMLLFKVSCL